MHRDLGKSCFESQKNLFGNELGIDSSLMELLMEKMNHCMNPFGSQGRAFGGFVSFSGGWCWVFPPTSPLLVFINNPAECKGTQRGILGRHLDAFLPSSVTTNRMPMKGSLTGKCCLGNIGKSI